MNSRTPKHKTFFFVAIGLTGLFAILTGFGKTFISPSLKGQFSAPPVIYIHGALAFSWVLLFLTQSLLVRAKQSRIHMRLGRIGLFIALGILITMIPVGLFQAHRELTAGLGGVAYSAILGTIISGLLFFVLVTLAIVWRRKPVYHKRIMVLATIVLLWPAWFRFRHYFPNIPQPEIWFALVLADSLILIAWAWDWWRHRQIHPSWLYGGLFIIIEQSIEVYLFDTPGWRNLGKSLFELFTGAN
ncbi:MAG: hypothetical protein KA821_18015 [Chitinophagaceae bacterium]|nr:hypothetical protein [Chitinophagaceae bacterium]